MVTETQELVVFHCVVKHANYAKAAEELGLSPSGVSRIVTRLEERLGVRLVQRTTRKLALTEAGAAFYARTSQILVDLADAEAEVQKTLLRPKGTLRLSASIVFGRIYVAPLVDALLGLYPELSIEISLSNRFVDLIEEGMDLAIRIGALADSRLIARRLCANRRVMVASPEYIARRGTPKDLDDLSTHECVVFTGFTKPREWRLIGPEGPVTAGVSGRLATNNIDVLSEASQHGLGITVGATMAVGPALITGELVRILPEYEFEPTSVFAVYPSARQLSTKVRATVDFLAGQISDPPSWDRNLFGKVPGFPEVAANDSAQNPAGNASARSAESS